MPSTWWWWRFLLEADFGFEAQHLLAIFAHGAVHEVLADQHFADAVEEGVDDQRVVVEIGSVEDFDVRIFRLRLVGGVVDALHEHAGEQEIREDDDAAVAESCRRDRCAGATSGKVTPE